MLAVEQAIATKSPSSRTAEETVVLAVEAMERDVNNGGYDQFFLNTPEFIPVIVTALRTIACPRCADITAAAIAVHQTPLDIGDHIDELEELDDAYQDDDEDIATQLFEFIKHNRAQVLAP